jgi:hypothetical protein
VQQGGGNFMLCTCMADMNALSCKEPEGCVDCMASDGSTMVERFGLCRCSLGLLEGTPRLPSMSFVA